MDLPGTFTVRLRASSGRTMEMGAYYLTSFLYEYSRALLERAIAGDYQFLDWFNSAGRLFYSESCGGEYGAFKDHAQGELLLSVYGDSYDNR